MSTFSSSSSQRARDSVLAGFAADSFSLGAHWEYNQSAITNAFKGRLTTLSAPLSSYHKGKTAGDLTHIGFNSLLLLRSLAQKESFDASDALSLWKSAYEGAQGGSHYLDSATKGTLSGLRAGKSGREAASSDDDMSHTIRWFPLVLIETLGKEEFVNAAATVTSSFQRAENQSLTAKFFAHVLYSVLYESLTPSAAMAVAAQQLNSSWLNAKIALGQKTTQAQPDANKALASFGLACSIDQGVPAFVYGVIRGEKEHDKGVPLSETVIDTVNGGGNCNARAISIATVLYAWKGIEPSDKKMLEWIAGLKQRQEIEADIAKLVNASKL